MNECYLENGFKVHINFLHLKKNLILLEHNLHIVGSYQIIHCVLQFQPCMFFYTYFKTPKTINSLTTP